MAVINYYQSSYNWVATIFFVKW